MVMISPSGVKIPLVAATAAAEPAAGAAHSDVTELKTNPAPQETQPVLAEFKTPALPQEIVHNVLALPVIA
jgi:hypothetical protein